MPFTAVIGDMIAFANTVFDYCAYKALKAVEAEDCPSPTECKRRKAKKE